MKKLFATIIVASTAAVGFAATPLWMRDVKISPDGKQIAFCYKGDIYKVASTGGSAVRLTSHDSYESVPVWSPDGKQIAFASDRYGNNDVFIMNADGGSAVRLTTKSGGEAPEAFSPDGKYVYFSANNQKPAASALFPDVLLELYKVPATGGRQEQALPTPAECLSFAKDGSMFVYQDRYGMRSHASWGSLNDVMLVFMNKDAYDKFRLSKEDYELQKELEKEQKKNAEKADADKKKGKKKDDKKADKKEEKKDIDVQLDGIEDRIVRITPNSSEIADAIVDADGESLYYLSAFEEGYDLWKLDLRKKSTECLKKLDTSSAQFDVQKDGKCIFILGSRIMQKLTVASDKMERISYKAEMKMDLAKEREYMFDHVCRQEARHFYRTDMHGVDWPMMTAAYRKFLPHINNNADFAELLSEMLGELNVSHTGGRYRAGARGEATANLGLFYDLSYEGKGVKIDEVIAGGPFDNASSKVKKGCIIEKINGQEISADTDFYALLAGLTGEKVLISLSNGGKQWDEVVKPISDGACGALLYRRWIKQRAADVDRWSNGRLGYVHIESMDDNSFRTVYSDVLGKYNKKEGIVIDTRFNGGGRLHEDIEILFSGTKYLTQVYRGREACDMPSRRWNKPSIMVQGEANYSNAHGTPWVYKHMRLGKLVGAPVPGTMTSVWWERLQDSSLIFGTPVIGYRTAEGNYLENSQLEPDIYVLNSPEDAANGLDAQLKAAVDELLRELDAKK